MGISGVAFLFFFDAFGIKLLFEWNALKAFQNNGQARIMESQILSLLPSSQVRCYQGEMMRYQSHQSLDLFFWAIFAIGFFLPWDERQYEKSSFLGNIYIYIVIFSKPPKKQIQVFQSMGFLESTFVTFCRTQVFLLRISDKVFGDPSLHPQSWNFKWSNQVTW